MPLLAANPLGFRWGVVSPTSHHAIAKFRREFVLAYGASPVVAHDDLDFSSGDYAWFGDSAERELAQRFRLPFVPIDSHAIIELQLLKAKQVQGVAKRIVLIGGESTGKTTLAQQLASHYAKLWVPEYCRLLLEHKGRGALPEDQVPIVRGQYALQKAILPFAAGLLVADTDLLMTMVYSQHYYGVPVSSMESLFTPQVGDCYLLLAQDLPWVPDPVRDSPKDREKIHGCLKKLATKYGLKPYDVHGIGPDRFHSAVKIIDAALNIY